MVGLQGNGHCREAQFYYHDFLQDRDRIPKPVADHIEGCAYCQAQVQRLRRMLSQIAAEGNSHRLNHSRELITELQSHFDHMGEQVTCHQVRRYLPGLLADRVRIPTPITVHVDQCDRCTEDMEHLRTLGLTREQLARLEELFTEPVQTDPSLCRQVKLMLADTDDLSFRDISAPLARHIRSCPQCRERVYEARQDLLYRCQERAAGQPSIGCGRIVGADLFDFMVPSGARPSDQAAADWHDVVCEHTLTCPHCLAKVQDMHRVLCGLAERADSGVVTVYTPAPEAAASTRKSLRSYAAYPIAVQVTGARRKPARRKTHKHNALMVTLKRRWRHPKVRTLVPAAAVSVVITVLVGLYIISSQAAMALNVGQISRKIAKQSNVHIRTIGKDGATGEELWSSKSVHLLAQKIGERLQVWDTESQQKYVYEPGRSTVDTMEKTDAAGLASTREYIRNRLNVGWNELPAGAEFQRLNQGADANDSLPEVYEVVFQGHGQGAGPVQYRMWFFLDSETQLPQRTELYQQQTPDGKWELQTTRLYDYPADGYMRGHFEQSLRNRGK